MINLCITAVYDILDPSYGGGARVLDLLRGLSEITEIEKIIVIYPFTKLPHDRNAVICNYLSHRSFNTLVPLHKIAIVDEINPFRVSSLIKIVRKFKINIIQNESIWGGVSSALVAKYCDVPFVIDEHNFETEYVREVGRSKVIQFYAMWLESKSLELADHVLTVSEEDKRKIISTYGIPLDKITVIPNGVDTVKFYPVSTYEKIRAKSRLYLNDKFVLVFHGSLDYGPNREAVAKINEFILPEIVKKIPEAFFLIIGRNPPSVPYNQRFLRFTGYVSDLAEYLAASDVAIVPVLRGGGTRLKVLEYLAMGIPIVATKKAVEGLPVKDKEHVLLSDGIDNEFITNILTLYNDRSYREKLSKNGRKLAEKYDWKTISKKLSCVYASLLA